MNRRLLQRFLEVYPFQPATAVWRASEVAALSAVPFPGHRGLDLGCGDGRLTRVLIETVGGLRLTGLDADGMETELARAEGLYETVHTSPADRIPELDASFDFVISISVLEHIPSLEGVLAEVARVLRAGGRFILTVPGPGFHSCLRGPLIVRSARTRYLAALDRRLAHLRYWTTSEWRGALAANDMTLLESRPILSCSEVRRWESVSRVTAGVLHAVSFRKPPIEIQRSLGMRRAGQRLPIAAARTLAGLLALGLTSDTPEHEDQSGCLLLIAARH